MGANYEIVVRHGCREHCKCFGGKKGLFTGAGGGGLWVPPQPAPTPVVGTPASETTPGQKGSPADKVVLMMMMIAH
jgi:hypothetical protein